MPQFLFSALDREGSKVTDRIESSNASSARYALETRGYSEIVFHTDEMGAAIDKALKQGREPEEDDGLWSAEEELAARQSGGGFSLLMGAIKGSAALWVPLAVWLALEFWQSPPYRWHFWLAAFLSVWLAWTVAKGLALGYAYDQLLRASVWHATGRVRFWVRTIRRLNRLNAVKVPLSDLDMRLACAMASEGKMDEALDLVRPYETDPDLPNGMYQSRLSSVYEASGNYAKMADCLRRAVELGSGGAAEHVDLAYGLCRRLGDVAESREALDKAREKEISDVVSPYISFCEGVMALNQNKPADACPLLTLALKQAQPYARTVLMQGWIAQTKAYLCIAEGMVGNFDRARRLLAEVEPLMKARKETNLLARCSAVCGR